MADELKKTYRALLIPAIGALLLACLAKELELLSFPSSISATFIAPGVFVLSVILAIASPILLRTLFAHRMRNRTIVPQPTLIRFERQLIGVALIAPYLIVPAYLLDFPDFYFLGTVLMALYAAYYFYPSEKRLRFEKRIFRVK